MKWKTIEKLGLFEQRAQELQNTRVLKKGFRQQLTLDYNIAMHRANVISRTPNEDDIRAFLQHLRPFLLEGEPINHFHIYNLCYQLFMGDELKKNLIESRKGWIKAQKVEGMRMIFDGKELTPEYVTNLWLYGYYFHNDYEKINELNNMLPDKKMSTKHQFFHFMLVAATHIIYTGYLIRFGFRERLIKTTPE